ncbi:MAG: lytic transglycosylase, partial [Comamonadaceae bacterium]
MKLLLAASLAASLVLAGCANTTPPPSPDQLRLGTGVVPPTTRAGTDAAPVYPGGPLSTLQAGPLGGRDAVAPLAPPADMWERIRRGFKMQNLEGDLVRDREEWYATRPDYIQRMT